VCVRTAEEIRKMRGDDIQTMKTRRDQITEVQLQSEFVLNQLDQIKEK
jgi:hypothetical protein